MKNTSFTPFNIAPLPICKEREAFYCGKKKCCKKFKKGKRCKKCPGNLKIY